MDIFLSIIIPSYNEQYCIENTLSAIIKYFKNKNYNIEIIIIDDGSIDNTREVTQKYIKVFADSPEIFPLEKIRIKLIENENNSGKGFSVKKGILKSSGQFVLFTDSDLSTPIEEFENLFYNLNKGFDIAIGSRDLPESKIIQHQNIVRESMGKVFNFFVRKLVKLDFRDTQCGFKLFKKEVANIIFPKMKINGFGFDVEVLYIAKRLGFKVIEVPVKWQNNKDSRVNILTDSLKMFLCLFQIKKLHSNT
jgi:dolichyl-phosphate beta-glucosyltransferase